MVICQEEKIVFLKDFFALNLGAIFKLCDGFARTGCPRIVTLPLRTVAKKNLFLT